MSVSMQALPALCVALLCHDVSARGDDKVSRIVVSKDKKGFDFESSGKRFIPWGFNYDHDEKGRLLQDYWETEWEKVERDFRNMKKMGANVVRIHLQCRQVSKWSGRNKQ
jgi:aryl-phospho-beta-D-glucosidase BglC (GH1 family)